jgi:hypothetical protein
LLRNYGKVAQKPPWSPPDGKEKRGTKHLSSWRATRQSYRPALTCSVPGGGTDAVQSANLNGPSVSSGFPSGVVVPTQGSIERHPKKHAQHTTDPTISLSPPVPCNQGPLQDPSCGLQQPWADSMCPYMERLLGTNSLRAKTTLELLIASWAKSTSDTCSNAIKPHFDFFEEQGLPPLAATTATMARYIAWIGE